jgi:hypothetical protein
MGYLLTLTVVAVLALGSSALASQSGPAGNDAITAPQSQCGCGGGEKVAPAPEEKGCEKKAGDKANGGCCGEKTAGASTSTTSSKDTPTTGAKKAVTTGAKKAAGASTTTSKDTPTTGTRKAAATGAGKKATTTTKDKPQTLCPVMGNAINKTLYVDSDGKRIYVCCAGCISTIKKDPAKYIKKLEDQGITLEKTPTTPAPSQPGARGSKG